MTNKNKKNFLRSFLATTSAFAVIAGASNSAMGVQYTTDDGGNPRIADGLATTHSNANGAVWVAHDSLFWSHARDLRLGTTANAATVATLDLNGQVGINIAVRNNSKIASLVDSSGNNQTAALVVNDGFTLTLGGNAGLLADGITPQPAGDFSALGNVTLGSGGGVGTLQIDAANALLAGVINSNVANQGVITVNAANVTFNGIIGGGGAATVLDQVTIAVNSSATFNQNVSAANGILLNGANAVVTLGNNVIVTGSIDSGGNGGETLNFVGAGQVTGTIGATNSLGAVLANGNGVVQLGNAINTATLNVKSGATVKAAHNSAAAIAAINIGEVGGAGTLVIDANVGDYNLPGGAVTFLHADSLLKLTNTKNLDRTVTLNANLAPGGDIEGRLEIHSNGTNELNVDINAGETIGTDNTHRLNELIVSGNRDSTIAPNIFAKTITVSSTADVIFDNAIDSGVLDATSIIFTADGGNLVLNGDVTTKTLNINNKTRTVTVDDGVNLNFDDILNGANSTLTFDGDSNLNLFAGKTVTVGTIEAAANGNTVNLGAGAYTVPDIQLTHVNGELELANGFNLTGGMNVAVGKAAAMVTFLGNGTVTGPLGGASAVGAVTVAGNNTTLQLGGNVNAASLDGNAANAQNLKFINAGNITVAGPVGGVQAFDQIEFNGGGRVEFKTNNAIHADNPLLHFTTATEVVTAGYDLDDTNITNTVGGNKLTVTVAQAITGNVGTLAQPFGVLHMDNAAATNVSINTANFFAGVTGNANVSFDHAGGSSVSFLGSNAANINNADFVENGRVFGEVHADTIDVQAGRTATFDGTVFKGTGMNMHANDAQADFTARVVLNMPILANAAGDGIIDFKGGVDLQQDVGTNAAKVATVGIGGDSTINANIYSNAINVADKNIVLANAATFDGVTTFTGTTITLGGNDLTRHLSY